MRKIIWLCFVLILNGNIYAQQSMGVKLHTGDLLFQNLDCGELCDAIEAVTDGFDGTDFSHIGLVYLKHDSVYVIEAIGKDVHLTAIETFQMRSTNKIYVGRVQGKYKHMVDKAIVYALKNIGVVYDDVFVYDNGRYYCSELIYDAFKYANNNKPFFSLEPMTFRKPGTKDFFTAWEQYYKDLNEVIPEGRPGINPGGISRSKKIEILNR